MEGAYQLTEKGKRIWEHIKSIPKIAPRKGVGRAPHHSETKGEFQGYLENLALVVASDYRIEVLNTLAQEEKDRPEIIKRLKEKFEWRRDTKEDFLEWHLEKLEGSDLVTRID